MITLAWGGKKGGKGRSSTVSDITESSLVILVCADPAFPYRESSIVLCVTALFKCILIVILCISTEMTGVDMMKIRNWRKKVTAILGAVCVCMSLGGTALAADFKIEARTGGILYGLYPQVGASSVMNAYWDATSAYAVTDGEYAYLGAILFVYAPGQVEESRPITVKFKTYTDQQGQRYLNLVSATDDAGHDEASYLLEHDGGLLVSLYTHIAKQTGMAAYL